MAKPNNKKKQPAPVTVTPSGTAAAAAHDAHGHGGHDDGQHVGHIVPFWILGATFGGLVILTLLTVALSGVPLGRLNLWVTLLIAGMKASLVVFFFMHLKWDRPLNGVIFLASLLFVMLFIGLAMTDTGNYQPDIQAWSSSQP